MSKVTLNNVTTFVNDTTAVNTVNTNNATIEAAFDNTLSRDGTSPNQMNATIDMNSNRVINLPAPLNGSEPLRLADAKTLNGGGTIQSIPAGGTTGQLLTKNSGTDYDVKWANGNVQSVGLAMPADFTVTNSPVTTIGTLTAAYATTPTGTGALVKATSPTLVTPTLGVASATSLNKVTITPPATGSTLTIADGKTLTVGNTTTISGTDSQTLTFQGSDTYVGRSTTDTLSNKTIDSANGNHVKLNGVEILRGQLLGTATNDNANAGNVGELMTSTVLVGSAVSLTSGTPANVTSLSLTAGDWDVWGVVWLSPGGTTTQTIQNIWINNVSATQPNTPSASAHRMQYFFAPGAGQGGAFPITPVTIQLSATTTIYLGCTITFATSTMAAYGTMWARRRR